MTSQKDSYPSQNGSYPINEEREMSLKEKVEILKSLQESTLDPSKLQEYLKYTSIPGLSVPILKKVLEYLTDLDSQISASYEILSDEDWERVISGECSILDKNFDVKTKIDCFEMYFKLFYEILVSNDISSVLDILAPLFKIKTKNIQFLILLVAKSNPKPVFGYVLSNLKKAPLIYCPFFSSLLVRLNFDFEIKQKCLAVFLRYISENKPSNSVQYLLLLQSLMYILCFKEFSTAFMSESDVLKADNSHEKQTAIIDVDRIWELIKKGEEMNSFAYLNRDVVSKFCEIYKLKEPAYHAPKNGLFSFFPFDLPVIPGIEKVIQNDYITFN
ncbi:uncharacterized protein VICG_01828 [Vittaforma corneae ATCC 50505]|uniref:Uncharacterized protein n=1 Tax=Vittaforma corneae (strain ATCC 50505) TaxID=993615 RepID=L2GKJ2_VITCO|nr:uncharacterized protein VICG_01828 [Vittaforma corneae ATCC 50505]ELA41129.1 hypothetical protein VICG_01828 [Vittaforma corneae ATCC 50505]